MPLRQAIERSQGWHRRLTVPQFTVVTGLLVILLGTLLLATPLCSSSKVGLWEALFTATSAITVTGLSIIDVGADLTTAGQLVLALMILAGGLGLMAITTFQGFVVKGTDFAADSTLTLDEFGVGGVGKHSVASPSRRGDPGGCFGALRLRVQRYRPWRTAVGLDLPQHLGLQQRRLRALVRQPGEYHDNLLVNAVVMLLIVMGDWAGGQVTWQAGVRQAGGG